MKFVFHTVTNTKGVFRYWNVYDLGGGYYKCEEIAKNESVSIKIKSKSEKDIAWLEKQKQENGLP